MTDIYCGNNRLNKRLVNKSSILGTRHGCMKKGIGLGINMPTDLDYLGDYEPIDERKVYCGNSNNLPEGYDSVGNLPQCLQRGIGMGKRIKAQSNQNNQSNQKGEKGKNVRSKIGTFKFTSVNFFLENILFIIIISLILNTFVYLGKPKLFEKKIYKNKKLIDTRFDKLRFSFSIFFTFIGIFIIKNVFNIYKREWIML
jgi:hypothetical protein